MLPKKNPVERGHVQPGSDKEGQLTELLFTFISKLPATLISGLCSALKVLNFVMEVTVIQSTWSWMMAQIPFAWQ